MAQTVSDRIAAIQGIVNSLSNYLGLDGIKVEMAKPMNGVNAYIQGGTTDGGANIGTKKTIFFPSNSQHTSGQSDLKRLITTIVHEMTHERQYEMASAYVIGNKTDIGRLFLAGFGQTGSRVNMGLYIADPKEAHARWIANKIIQDLFGEKNE